MREARRAGIPVSPRRVARVTMVVRPASGLDRQIGLAAHHHRLAHGEAAEMLQIGLEPPRHVAAQPDHAVVGDGGDEDELDTSQLRRGRTGAIRSAHTATFALMCGYGS
jgi:hypothetical protein